MSPGYSYGSSRHATILYCLPLLNPIQTIEGDGGRGLAMLGVSRLEGRGKEARNGRVDD